MSHWPSSSPSASAQSPIAESMVCEHDWAKSRIGPPPGWPAEWRAALRVCLASRRASFLALGHDLELVYNDRYAGTFRAMHPWSFGRPLREAWAEVWEERLESHLSRVLLGQRQFAAVEVTAVRALAVSGPQRLVMSLSIICDARGAQGGLFGTVVEARSEGVDEDRLLSLHELVTQHISKCSLEEAESACLHALARAPRQAGALLRRVAAQLATATVEASGDQGGESAAAARGRSRSEFISRLSFQLRTSLTPVLGEIEELLACDHLSAKELAQVRAAWRSARRLSNLVDALLEFSRFEDGDVTLSVTAVDLAQATKRLCGLVRTAFERAGIAFTVDCPPLPEAVAVDREMWEKVLSSLLSNALKFTIRGSVRIEQHIEGEWVVLTVSDTGAGIDEQTLPHIFDRFFSATPPGAHAHDGGGSGIGLSLARELIRLHGGDIEVSSALGRGSTFTVRIPYRNAPLEQGSEEAQLEERAQSAVAMTKSHESGAAAAVCDDRADRILVVDDNVDTCEYLYELLGSHWPVEIAGDGQRALTRAREAVPGLIVADLVMPGLDGLSLVRKLRRDPRTYQVPVVILSAQADEHTAIEGLHAGAVDYVVKPFSGKELVARIEGLLALSRERRGERAARESAEHELRLRDEFIATMSHELRAPLSAIVGWAEILRDEGSPPERRVKALEVIERNARTQTRLIADLLDVSRIATGSFRMELETLRSIGPIVRAALEALTPFAQQRGVLLDMIVDEPTGPLRGDPQRLQQVVWNLVSNALKFTPPGGRVHILCGNRDGSVLIRVADTGQGIVPEFLPHVFERFAQEPRLGSKHGLGLGLAIVQGILELHSGTISVESAGEGCGTTFTVRLPLLLEQ